MASSPSSPLLKIEPRTSFNSIKKGKLVVGILFIGMMLLAITFVTLFLVQYFDSRGTKIFIAYTNFNANPNCIQGFVIPQQTTEYNYHFALASQPIAFSLLPSQTNNSQTSYSIKYRGENVQPSNPQIPIQEFVIYQTQVGFYTIGSYVNGLLSYLYVDTLDQIVMGGGNSPVQSIFFYIGPFDLAHTLSVCN